MVELLDNSRIVSKERAIRGAKIGILTAEAAIVSAWFLDIASGVPLEALTSEEILTAVGTVAASLGAAGAVIDGFKPTSWLINKYIERQVGSWHKVKDGIKGAPRFFRGLAQDTSRLAYDIFRPQVSPEALNNKACYLRNGAIFGLASGLSVYAVSGGSILFDKAARKVDQLLGLSRDPNPFISPLYTVLDHPAETIAAGTLIGLGIAGQRLLFHRPTEQNFVQHP